MSNDHSAGWRSGSLSRQSRLPFGHWLLDIPTLPEGRRRAARDAQLAMIEPDLGGDWAHDGGFRPKNQGFFELFQKIPCFSGIIWLTSEAALSTFPLIVRTFPSLRAFARDAMADNKVTRAKPI